MLRVYSDLHLEFGGFQIPVLPNERETILVLAGDITTSHDRRFYWFEKLACRFRRVVYVLGNHEFYGGDLSDVRGLVQDYASIGVDAHYLGVVHLDGLKFICATLWTDFLGNQSAIVGAAEALNDYSQITCAGNTLTGFDVRMEHRRSLEFIQQNITPGCVVVTHTPPTIQCKHPSYDDRLDPYFYSALENKIDWDKVSLWVYGHTHRTVLLDSPRIVGNPRGYPEEINPDFDPLGLNLEV